MSGYSINKIEELKKLPDKWDGEHAKPVTLAATKNAIFIAYLVSGNYIKFAQFFPLPTGGVQIEWFINENELEIEIDENGTMFVVAVDNSDSTLFEHEFELSNIEIINKIRQEVKRLGQMLSL